MKQLILCEKPSVARAVAIALSVREREGTWYESPDWIVASASGHLLQMAEPHLYDPTLEEWRAEDLPILPERFRWVPRENAERRLETLKKLIRRDDVGAVVNACDAAREGELIFKLIFRWAGVEKPVKRAWFSSLTSGAIRRAFEALRPDEEMKGLENAAFAREVGDWLIGINATRAASLSAGAPRGRPVSLGRVQTPALRLLVDREREVDAYLPIPYFRVRAELGAAPPIPALVVDEEGEILRLEAEGDADALAGGLAGEGVRVERYSREEREVRAPLPFDLATLQVEASRAFGWSAARTLATAQRLYEQRYISYPRTDSRFLTWDLKPQLPDAAEALAHLMPELEEPARWLADQARGTELSPRPFNNALVRDHHAIIPTSRKEEGVMADSDRRLYEMIARRFLAAFHGPLLLEVHRAELAAGGSRLGARGTRVLEAGWRTVEGPEIRVEDAHLPALETLAALEGAEAPLSVEKAESEKRFHPRPRAHTDGSLIRAMERAGEDEPPDPEAAPDAGEEPSEAGEEEDGERHIGIGTPATRSSIIEILVQRRYALRDRRAIFATIRGRRLIEHLDAMEIASPRLTSRWEGRLDQIREGAEDPEAFEGDLRSFTGKTVTELLARPLSRIFDEDEVLGPCPRCDGEILIRNRAFGCSSWKGDEQPGCGWVVFRNLSTGRIGLAEARYRLEHDMPIAGRRTVPVLPPASESGEAAGLELGLEPYSPAEDPEEPLPAGEDEAAEAAWRDAILAVLEVEGPLMVRRITRLLQGRAGGGRARAVKRKVNRLTARLVREEALAEVDEGRRPAGQQDRILRLPDQPDVHPRLRGPRDGRELPHGELAAVLERLREREPEAGLEALARVYQIDPESAPEEQMQWLAEALGVPETA